MNKKRFITSLILSNTYCLYLKLLLGSILKLYLVIKQIVAYSIVLAPLGNGRIKKIISLSILLLVSLNNSVYAYNIAVGPVFQIADASTNAKSTSKFLARTYYFQRIGIGGYSALYGDIVPILSYSVSIDTIYNIAHKIAFLATTEKTFREFFKKKSKRTKSDKYLNYQFDKQLPLVFLKFSSLYCPITFKLLLNIGPYFSTYLGSVLNIRYFLKTEEKLYWDEDYTPCEKYNDLYFNFGAVFGIRACTLGNFLILDLCILSTTMSLYDINTNKTKNKLQNNYKHHTGMELSSQISLRCDLLALIYMPERKKYVSSKDIPIDY